MNTDQLGSDAILSPDGTIHRTSLGSCCLVDTLAAPR